MQPTKSADAGSAARGRIASKSSELDNRYAKIGISAVAAAVRYKSDDTPRDRTPLYSVAVSDSD